MTDRIEVQIAADATGLVREADRAGGALQDFGRIVDRVGGIAGNFKADFALLGTAFIGVQGAVQAAAAAFNMVTQAFKEMNAEVIDAESVAGKLAATFDGAEASAGRLAAQATKLAGGTVFFDDDAIKNAAAVLRSFELTESEIGKLLPAAINLATVFGTDLNSASERLANGLTGSTRGLREFGIVVKEGSDRSAILAEILARGERAAAGAALAQEGLRGKTAALKTAQGEFNQALGELLSGPNQAFLQFLTDATKKATELAAGMSGAAAQAARVSKVIDPKTGTVKEAPSTGTVPSSLPAGLRRQLEDRGILPVDPAEKARRQAEQKARADKAAEDAAKEREQRRKQDERAAASRRQQEQDAARETARYLRQQKAMASEEDKKEARQERAIKKAEEEAARVAQQAQDKRVADELAAAEKKAQILKDAADKMNEGLLSAANQAAAALGSALAGGEGFSAQNLVSIASAFASAIAPQFAPIIGLLGSLASGFFGGKQGAGSQTIEDRIQQLRSEREASNRSYDFFREFGKGVFRSAGSDDAELMRLEQQLTAQNAEAARIQLEAAQYQKEASERARRESLQARADVFLPIAGQIFNRLQQEQPETFGGLSGFKLLPILGKTEDELAKLGDTAAKFLGGQNVDISAIQALVPSVDKSSEAFKNLLVLLAEMARRPGVADTEEAQRMGESPRNPVYVFDVTPSRDEFTQAPRGLFFRPVGVDRGVSGGQALSGVTSGTTNRGSGTGRSYGSGGVRRLG